MNRPLLSALVVLPALAGCASRDAKLTNYAVRAAPTTDRGSTLDAAEATLVSLGFAIAKRDTAGGVVVTEPIDMEEAARSIRADNPTRKYAEIRVTGTAADLKVQCKVVIQEQATESYRFFAYERGGDDLPGHQTAIDRDAATTAEQNTVWRTVRRDKLAEREILDRISQPPSTP